jgi:aspartate racemase
MTARPNSRCFGLIGGLGTPSTVFYYQMLIKSFEARGAPARFFVANADFDRVLQLITENDAPALAGYFASLIGSLKRAGAEFVALSAVMPHLCMPELEKCSPLPVLDIVEVLKRHLSEQGFSRIALLGTRVTMETKLFGRLAEYDLVDLPTSDLQEVQRIYRSIQVHGSATADDTLYLRALGKCLHESKGAQIIAVAGTDLSTVFHGGSEPFPLYDCASSHIEAIVEQATSSTTHVSNTTSLAR